MQTVSILIRSDLSLNCLLMSLLWDARLKCVERIGYTLRGGNCHILVPPGKGSALKGKHLYP